MGDVTIANDLIAGIDDIADEIGTTAHIRRTIESSDFIDSDQPSKGKTITTTDIAVSVIADRFKKNEIDGELVKAEDKKWLMSLNDISITPTTNDLFVEDKDGSNTEIYRIMAAPEVEVSGTNVMIELQVRLGG